jgi:hypothetical protein
VGFLTGLGLPTMMGRPQYYMQDTGYPGSPDIEECGAVNYDGTQGTGIYRTAFNMNNAGATTGAAIIVFEVGNVYEDADGADAVDYAQPDKLTWEYNGVFNSEYSAVHMGDTDDSGSNPDVMHGIGYMRGLIGSEVMSSKNLNGSWANPAVALSQVTGSRLLSGGAAAESLTWNNTAGSSTTYSGPTTPDTDDRFGSTGQYAITAYDKEYEYLDITQANAASVAHGTFKDLDRFLWDTTAGAYVAVSTGNFAGVYTGHDQEETADINGNSYVGSSAITLHENDNPYASRQAMMVVPVVNAGIINIHIEAPLHGTWHRHMCLCPIKLPKWGNADNKTGIQSDGTPYDNATDAGNHNFSDPSSPTSGSVAGENTTYYHVNSQDRQYRQQGMSSWSGTARSGGHVISALDADSAGSTEWKGVVNRFDWVFTDSGGGTRVPVGFYAIDIGGTVYVVEVGDTNTAGIAQAGVVKDITA